MRCIDRRIAVAHQLHVAHHVGVLGCNRVPTEPVGVVRVDPRQAAACGRPDRVTPCCAITQLEFSIEHAKFDRAGAVLP